MAQDSQRCLSTRVLAWLGLRPLSKNPHGVMMGDVESGSGGLMSIVLADVRKAHASASLSVFRVVCATLGSYLKSSGRMRVAFWMVSQCWRCSGSMLFRTQIGHTPCALKFVRVSPRSLKFRCALLSSGWARMMAWRCARFWVSTVSEKTLPLGCRSSLGYREKRGKTRCSAMGSVRGWS